MQISSTYAKQKDLLNPLLKILSSNDELSHHELIDKLANYFQLDENFLNQRYEKTGGKKFAHQVMFAITGLHKTGLINFERKGKIRYFYITEMGKVFLDKTNDEISRYINKAYPRKKVKKLAEKIEIAVEPRLVNFSEMNMTTLKKEVTILEQLENTYHQLRQQRYQEILDIIISKTPQSFEKIVTALLQKMGYGDGSVTQLTRDGGIDATIKGDILGFEKIYVQAKRYQKDKTIGRQDIQGFVGALMGLGGNATKGVFITTAKFSQDAESFANNFSNAKVVLIDGIQLAEYIYNYQLGMQVEKEFTIKKLDSDFWDMFDNDI